MVIIVTIIPFITMTMTGQVLLGRDLRRSSANSASFQTPSLLRGGGRGALRAAWRGGTTESRFLGDARGFQGLAWKKPWKNIEIC